MILTLDLPNEIAEATTEAASHQKSPQEGLAMLIADDFTVGATLSERGFLMAAEGTRHVWDTPEEDKAWAHL